MSMSKTMHVQFVVREDIYTRVKRERERESYKNKTNKQILESYRTKRNEASGCPH